MRRIVAILGVLWAMFHGPIASASFADAFAASFSDEVFPVNWRRFQQVADQSHLAMPSSLENWGFINRDSAASYNGILNTLIFKSDFVVRTANHSLRLASLSELRASLGPSYRAAISTIFHEMAHAEFSNFVESPKTIDDFFLREILFRRADLWLREAHPELTAYTRKLTLSEIFAYYHSDLIELILNDAEDLIVANGYNLYTDRCFNSAMLQKLAAKTGREEFLEILPIGSDSDLSYRKRFELPFVWVRGAAVELSGQNASLALDQTTLEEVGSHFIATYGLPRHKRELAKALSRTPKWHRKVSACHAQLWDEVHLQKASAQLNSAISTSQPSRRPD